MKFIHSSFLFLLTIIVVPTTLEGQADTSLLDSIIQWQVVTTESGMDTNYWHSDHLLYDELSRRIERIDYHNDGEGNRIRQRRSTNSYYQDLLIDTTIIYDPGSGQEWVPQGRIINGYEGDSQVFTLNESYDASQSIWIPLTRVTLPNTLHGSLQITEDYQENSMTWDTVRILVYDQYGRLVSSPLGSNRIRYNGYAEGDTTSTIRTDTIYQINADGTLTIQSVSLRDYSDQLRILSRTWLTYDAMSETFDTTICHHWEYAEDDPHLLQRVHRDSFKNGVWTTYEKDERFYNDDNQIILTRKSSFDPSTGEFVPSLEQEFIFDERGDAVQILTRSGLNLAFLIVVDQSFNENGQINTWTQRLFGSDSMPPDSYFHFTYHYGLQPVLTNSSDFSSSQQFIAVFPNPATTWVRLEGETSEVSQFVWHSLSGKRLSHGRVLSDQILLPDSDKDSMPGLLLLSIFDDFGRPLGTYKVVQR